MKAKRHNTFLGGKQDQDFVLASEAEAETAALEADNAQLRRIIEKRASGTDLLTNQLRERAEAAEKDAIGWEQTSGENLTVALHNRTLLEAVEALCKQMLNYVDHDPRCATQQSDLDDPCTCGLDSLRAKLDTIGGGNHG